MKVLELISNHHWTGPAEPVLGLSEHMSSLGVDVRVACSLKPDGNLPAKIADRGLSPFPELSLYKRRFHPVYNIKDLRALARSISDGEFDILHCHLSHDHWLCLTARALSGSHVRIVRTVHNSAALRRRPLQGAAYRLSDGLISIGRRFAETLEENFRLPGEKIAVIPGAVNHRRFRPPENLAEIRRSYGFGEDQFLVGIVSRIKAGRGHPELLDAFRVISVEIPDSMLVMIGRGEFKSEMENAAGRIGLSDRVRFLGYIDEDLPQAVGMLDLNVILGEGSDGSCRAALEAMACGVPVLAAPVGTLPETIEADVTGVLLPALSVRGITENVLRLARDREYTAGMGARAREAVESRFTEQGRAEATVRFFERLMVE